jgi:hypothetical protein
MAPHLYQVSVQIYKSGILIRVVQKRSYVLPLYIILVKIVEVAEIKYLFYIRIASENLGITCYYQQFIIRVLCFYGLAYCCGGYTFAYATIYLKYNIHACFCSFWDFVFFFVFLEFGIWNLEFPFIPSPS